MQIRIWVGLGLAAAGSAGCDRSDDKSRTAPSASTVRVASAAPSSGAASAPAPRAAELDEPERRKPSEDAGAFQIAQLEDVGPAAPASASAAGVVMVTRDDEIALAAPGDQGKLTPVALDGGSFSAFTRAPGITASHAYWVSKGRLVRKKLTGAGPLEVLSEDARDGTRTAPVSGDAGRPDATAYVARPSAENGDPLAMLWVEGGGQLRLSPEGSAASSVALATQGDALLAVYVEGRTGMSPVHARRIRFEARRPVLEEDVVVWVGGAAQSLTEIAGGQSKGEAWAFLPLERDATRFGLAQIRLGKKPEMGAPVTWRGYPNGMAPAPIFTAEVCHATLVAYARPSDAKPGAPQELELAALGAEGLEPGRVIGRSKAFTSVSLAATRDGALVAWVADHRTWASRVRCPPDRK